MVDPTRPVVGNAVTLPRGSGVAPHSHRRAQLAWAVRGVLRIVTSKGSWIVPPSHAVWIRPGESHKVTAETEALMRHIFVEPSAAGHLDAGCRVVEMTALMRELILRIMTFDITRAPTADERRLMEVAVDEVARLTDAPLYLPAGRDRRLQTVMRMLSQNPGERRKLTDLGAAAGASARTLERLFHAETGMSFQQWTTRLRMIEAVELLSRGESSMEVAGRLGFAGPSAFSASFRKHFGRSPQTFGRDR